MALKQLVEQNFEMHSGDTVVIVVTVLTGKDQVVPITGATAIFIVAKSENGSAIFSKSVGSGIVLTDPVQGVMTITLNSGDTEALVGVHYMELELTDAALRVSTIVVGHINIRKNVIQ